LEAWLYIYLGNFKTRCLKSDARKCFPPLCNCAVAWRCRPICQARLTCSCNSALVTDAWNEWTFEVVDIVLPKGPAKIQPSCVFWRFGCSEDLTWPTHIRFQNKSTPIKRSISNNMWNRGSAKRMLCGKLNLSRAEETAGILSVTWSVTMHSITAVYELSRDCNLILTMWLDEVTVPLTPEIETFSGRVSKPRASTNFLATNSLAIRNPTRLDMSCASRRCRRRT